MRASGSATLTLVPLEAVTPLQAESLEILGQIQPETVFSFRKLDLGSFEELLPGTEETVVTPPIHERIVVLVGHRQDLLFRRVGLFRSDEDVVGLHQLQPPTIGLGVEAGAGGDHEHLVPLGEGLLELSARIIGDRAAVGGGGGRHGFLTLPAGPGLEDVARGEHRDLTVAHRLSPYGKAALGRGGSF